MKKCTVFPPTYPTGVNEVHTSDSFESQCLCPYVLTVLATVCVLDMSLPLIFWLQGVQKIRR